MAEPERPGKLWYDRPTGAWRRVDEAPVERKPFPPATRNSGISWGDTVGKAIGAALVIGLYFNGTFDRALMQAGLDDFISGRCIRTFAGTVYCGNDEIAAWCRAVGVSDANRAACAD